MLRRALDENPHLQWPGRTSAEADYALGLLIVGDTTAGVPRLSQAQHRFVAEGEVELLAKSLWNEHQYLMHAEADAGQIDAVKKRLASMRL